MAAVATTESTELKLTVENFTFDPRPNYPLLLTAKRYRLPNNATTYAEKYPGDDITLIFTHCVGGHKEQWEPTIEHLFSLALSANGREKTKIREAWSIDWPNHGDAAVLNEKTLQWGYEHVFPWDDLARALHLFLCGLGSTTSTTTTTTSLPKNYFRKHNLVGIGHSIGAVSILLSQTLPNPPNWKSIILVEPPMVRRQDEENLRSLLLRSAESRRELWTSKSAAFESSLKKGHLSGWDPRVLKRFCEAGLREVPTLAYPDVKAKGGVTLKCTKVQEAACYKDRIGLIRAYNYIKYACDAMPIHVIYGAIDDWVSLENKLDLIKNAAQGKLASVQRVPGAGHQVVQVAPEGLAISMHKALLLNNHDASRQARERHGQYPTHDHDMYATTRTVTMQARSKL